MVKPAFVPKSERDPIVEREHLEAEEQEARKRRRLEERKIETRHLLVQEIQKDEEIQKNMDLADIDTDDEVNEAEDYEAWKVREIFRIKKERKEVILKNGKVRENPKPAPQTKKKWRFMKKYYHKGVFFQSDPDDRSATVGTDEIYNRGFSAPTGEDKMDKTILTKVMQVKHFGRSGRTKWIHLVKEDTTDWSNPWTYNDSLRANYNDKVAAMNAPIARPKGSRKLKDWESG
ncbi:hypothetical protein L6164_003179 [Bauhinia variegata]|uniref:Uncharacterized protein n=1 Tax=Bauhinia variegata TaxID=167791 RepID=A0ACB9Q612_BAUVA|nr:hypothetical protein L6164_003179 [Bauhinia variegata]